MEKTLAMARVMPSASHAVRSSMGAGSGLLNSREGGGGGAQNPWGLAVAQPCTLGEVWASFWGELGALILVVALSPERWR